MSETADNLPAHKRLSTGITGLDRILNGGFLKGRIYLIMGPPGAGKTVLSNQISFHHVAAGGRVLYLSLLTETSSRMLADLQAFPFFTAAPIGNDLSYVSGYTILQNEGLDGLISLIRTEVRRLRATLLVIDGVMIAEQTATSNLDWKRFLHALQAATELLECTMFLLAPLDEHQISRGEQTSAEGTITLTRRLVDVRSVRELQVLKFRGSSFLEGRHLYTIDTSGFVVHPRLEMILPPSLTQPQQAMSSDTLSQPERRGVGIAQLDKMLHGGLPAGSTTLLLGTPGTGKTLLGSHFLLQGAAQGQKGLYYSFYEQPAQLVRKLAPFDLHPERFVASGQLELIWNSPLNDFLDVLAEHILEAVHRSGAQRLFIDGLSGFQRSVASPERLDLFLTAFFTTLSALDITVVCSVELPDLFSPQVELPTPISGTTALVDNVLLLRYVELRSQLYRLISILKMRASGYDPSIREFQISEQGIEVAPTFSSAEAILTGIARLRSEMSEAGVSSRGPMGVSGGETPSGHLS